VVVKDAVAVYGVVSFLAIRFAIGCSLIGTASVRRFSLRPLRVGACIGVVLAVAYLFQTFGLRYTTATNCGLITGLFVVFAPLANRLLFGVRTGRVFWAAIALSIVGLFLLTGSGPDPLATGDFLTLGAAACFGLHIALLDRYAKHHDTTLLAFWQLASASLVFLVVWPLTEPFLWPPGEVWFALIVTGVLATAAAFFIQTYVQRRLPAVRTAIVISTEPIFAAFFGYTLAGDRLGGLQLAGGALMIAAVVLAEVVPALLANGSTTAGGRKHENSDLATSISEENRK